MEETLFLLMYLFPATFGTGDHETVIHICIAYSNKNNKFKIPVYLLPRGT